MRGVLWVVWLMVFAPGVAAGQAGCPADEPGAPVVIPERALGVRPGATDTLRVLRMRGPYGPEPLPQCRPAWSLSPRAPAQVDRATGVLRVRPGAAHGTAFTVYADLGGRRAETRIHVVDPRRNPLVGLWKQTAGTPCGSTASAPTEEGVQELRFRADGTFDVTWIPFESYVDYRGRYTYAAPALRLRVEGGNHVPTDVDPDGQATVAPDGTLRLTSLSLGTPRGGGPRYCTALFRRLR
jgi:hypothetical protein